MLKRVAWGEKTAQDTWEWLAKAWNACTWWGTKEVDKEGTSFWFNQFGV